MYTVLNIISEICVFRLQSGLHLLLQAPASSTQKGRDTWATTYTWATKIVVIHENLNSQILQNRPSMKIFHHKYFPAYGTSCRKGLVIF